MKTLSECLKDNKLLNRAASEMPVKGDTSIDIPNFALRMIPEIVLGGPASLAGTCTMMEFAFILGRMSAIDAAIESVK